MRAIFTADLHLHPWRDCSRNSGQDRLQDGLSSMEQTLQMADERKCDWVFLGDIKVGKFVWPQAALNGALALMEKYQTVRKYMLSGNHDGLDQDGKTGLSPFVRYARVMQEPSITVSGNTVVAWWPYKKKLHGLSEFLKKCQAKGAKILCAHQFISGAEVGPHSIQLGRVGAALHQFGLSQSPRGRPVFEWGFLGDVHKRQALRTGQGGPQVYYAGSPYAQNWGERELDKGCIYADLTKRTVEFLTVKAPRYRIMDWSHENLKILNGHLMPGFLRGNEVDGVTISKWHGDFVRILVPVGALPGLLEKIGEKSKARFFRVVEIKPPTATGRTYIHAGMGEKQMLQKYLSAVPPEGGFDTQVMLASGMKLWKGGK